MIKRPIYNRDIDGPDVFGWILEAAHVYRNLKRQEREYILKELSTTPAIKGTEAAVNAPAARNRRRAADRSATNTDAR